MTLANTATTDYSKYTILIVDDEEMLREVMSFDFERKGFKILSAENGAKAFELIKANKVDMVISDMRMPGGDGMTLLEQIRAYDPMIPALIFVSGFTDYTEAECVAKGATQVVSKPFDRKVLMSAVLSTLGLPPN